MSEQATTPEGTTTATGEGQALAKAIEDFQKPKNKLGRCECAYWEIGPVLDAEDPNVDQVEIHTTGCDRQTKRMFAQGHDAKLKSLLIKAGVEGWEVRFGRLHGVIMSMDAETAAARFGFGAQVESGIRNRLDKLARSRKAIPAAPRAVGAEVVEGSQEGDAAEAEEIDVPAIPQAPAEQDDWADTEPGDEAVSTGIETVKGKVGRWIYDGVVAADGSFHYRAGNDPEGEARVADAGKWTPAE